MPSLNPISKVFRSVSASLYYSPNLLLTFIDHLIVTTSDRRLETCNPELREHGIDDQNAD